MSRGVPLLRFFRVVPPVAPVIVGLLALTVFAASVAVCVDSSRAADALVVVCLLQVFAASSGFMMPARRGYYDMPLTRMSGRGRILLMHWAASVAPGILGWLTLAAVEAGARGDLHPRALSSGSLAAMWLVSSLPWALTLPLPRFAGALGWLVTGVSSAMFFPASRDGLVGALQAPEPSLLSMLAFLAYPVGLIGHSLTPAQWTTVLPGVGLAFVLLAGACLWVSRSDIRLEAAQ